MGREVVYLSEAKLRSFSLDPQAPARRLVTPREVEGKLETPYGGVSGRLGPAPEPSDESSDDLQKSYDRLERVLAQLSSSLRAPRDIDDPRLRVGSWASFAREIKFGHFHRDKGPYEWRVVLSRGAAQKEIHHTFHEAYSAPPPEPEGTDFLLSGWVGHMIEAAIWASGRFAWARRPMTSIDCFPGLLN